MAVLGIHMELERVRMTACSMYDYSWILDGEDEEWNRFILREMFNEKEVGQ